MAGSGLVFHPTLVGSRDRQTVRLTPQRIMQIVDKWRIRAVTLGYIQQIPQEDPIPAPTRSVNQEAAPAPRRASKRSIR
jgi:hypothetical protein